MKREYVRPEYDSNIQLEDIMRISVQESEDGETIKGIVDIEDLFDL